MLLINNHFTMFIKVNMFWLLPVLLMLVLLLLLAAGGAVVAIVCVTNTML